MLAYDAIDWQSLLLERRVILFSQMIETTFEYKYLYSHLQSFIA